MDFITQHPKIYDFLSQHPREEWERLVITAILNGIPYTSLPTAPKNNQASLPHLRQQLNNMKEELERLNKSLENSKPSTKPRHQRQQTRAPLLKNKSQSQKKLQDFKNTVLVKSPHRQ